MSVNENDRYGRIAICIITCLRPKGLSSLLEGINTLSTYPRAVFQVIIIDNDDQGSAREVYLHFKEKCKFSLVYTLEKRRGIPFARNKALKIALDEFEYIAFIDDDEIPSEKWLIELINTQKRYEADAVMGPVLPLFAPDTPSWVKEGKFFEKKRFSDGHVLSSGSTCNVLIRAEIVRKYDLKFEESMALTGGTDALFFHLMAKKGGKMVWSDNAIVYEQIPSSRANAKWILRRAYRFGNSLGLRDLKAGFSFNKACGRIMKGMGYIGLGILSLIFTFPFGKIRIIKSIQNIMRGMGNITGLLNIGYEEYKTIHKI